MLSKIRATKAKKAGAAQPPCSPAPMQSPAAQSGPASARTAAGHGAMDGAQQLVEESPTDCIMHNCGMAATPFSIPQFGMAFSSFDEAWNFWVIYGGRMGFDIRRCYTNTSDLDGLVTLSRFVCLFQSRSLG